ncbi:hypothetical protein QKT49_gp241 [Acanthamoeba castellanii medusavirus]|uniref:Uncharacterized protein n=1 Tax=Acanthamoeba castellanii medusavirus J1 TaxID=3114988 RepID=A0A3T1CXF6_9VIRU|nr:hypothetical protein QKT49_gp241 [Acanthamoeba castellanii medusavirus]BBI30522.1 hypothetical protein [Acanthamoeba castellanii medusavirus J1]
MGNTVKYTVYEFMSTRAMHFAFRSVEYYSSRRFLYDAKAGMLRCALACPVVCNHGDGVYVCEGCRGYAEYNTVEINRQLSEHLSRPRPEMPSFPPCTRCKRDTNVNEDDFLRCDRCGVSWCATCWWRSDALATYCGDEEGCAACVKHDPDEINCENAPWKFICKRDG